LLLESVGFHAKDLILLGAGLSFVAWSFQSSLPGSTDEETLVIRVQMWEPDAFSQYEAISTSATLRYLGPLLGHLPQVVKMDTTADNLLKHAYMITTYLPGVPWGAVLEELPFDERLQICQAVADEIDKFRGIRFSSSGRLEADPEDAYCVRTGPFRQGNRPVPGPATPETAVKDWFLTLLDWRAEREEDEWMIELCRYRDLQKMIREMDELGYFANYTTTSDTILSHEDLHENNILVRKAEDGQWEVTGIIDWDGACAVPPVIACRSLEWMWSDSYVDNDELLMKWTGDLDFVSEELIALLPADMLQLKQAMDEYMASKDPNYMQDVYGHGRWIRRVEKFAEGGWTDDREFKMVNWLIDEWNAHRGKIVASAGERESSEEGKTSETTTKNEDSHGADTAMKSLHLEGIMTSPSTDV